MARSGGKTRASGRGGGRVPVEAAPAPAWPADSVERRLISGLVPYAKNARTHSEEQIGQIADSIQHWGWTTPVLVDEAGGIIAGHGRVLAAQKLGIVDVPVMVARGWTEEQKRAYVIADNKLALNAGWDEGLLRIELTELQGIGVDLGLTGFGKLELDGIFARGGANSGLTDPDETPEAPAVPVSVLGDVWLLGRHRLVCGDSTDADTVAKALNGVTPHLMVTDPPYGVEYDPNWRNSAERSTQIRGRKIGATAVGKVMNDGRADWREAWSLFPGDIAYVWHAGLHASAVAESLAACDFEIRSQIIWNKAVHIIGRGDYHWKHEPCWYVVRRGKTGRFNRSGEGGRKQNTVWDIEHRASDSGHGTQKPVECMKRPIENNSSAGQAVYEPFSGSGTTIIAGEMTGRSVHAIELSPAYVDVGVTRWQAFTGQVARLEETGETFAELLARRQPSATIIARAAD